MNLLKSPWLPVILADGRQANLRVQDIPASGAIAIAHPRGDFAALALELLIDLFQTVASPVNKDQLDDWLCGDLPELSEAIDAWASAFELFGERPFMQLPPAPLASAKKSKADDDDETGELLPAGALLFESPGKQTRKRRVDFFVRAHQYQVMCPICAAIGLYMGQAHAVGGGTGYFTGPRSGSALTAILVGRTLWETICLNLLPASVFQASEGAEVKPEPELLPWRNRANLMEEDTFLPVTRFGRYGVLWWSPRTFELYPAANTAHRPCDVCGEIHEVHVPKVTKGAIRARLAAGVKHPRTAWLADKTKVGGGPLEVPVSGFTAEAWGSLLLTKAIEDSLPAYTALTGSQRTDVAMRCFGFSMDKASPLRWMDETTPLVFPANPEFREVMQGALEAAVKHVAMVASALGSALYRPKPKDASSTNPIYPFTIKAPQAKQELWLQMTSPILEMLRIAGEGQPTAASFEALKAEANQVALRLFDQASAPLIAEFRFSRLLLNRRAELVNKLTPKEKKPKKPKKPKTTTGSKPA